MEIKFPVKLLCFLSILQSVFSFNMDVNQGNIYQFLQDFGNVGARNRSSSSSRFGASLSILKINNAWKLVVGAPTENATNKHDGSVYQCNVDISNTCSKVATNTGSADYTAGQLMGFATAISGDKIIACAPHYHDQPGDWAQYRGKCSILAGNNFTQLNAYSPCEIRAVNQDGYGFCTLGTSVTGSSTKELFIIGVPGAVNWRGVVSVIRRDPINGQYVDYTSEEYMKDTPGFASSFFGYSVAFGIFTNENLGDVAVSAPRVNNLRGKVHIIALQEVDQSRISFNHRDEITIPTEDDQVGSYFGATIAAVDVNNDRRDDLLVAAPFFSKRAENEGRVYLYMNSIGTFVGLRYKAVLTGELTKGGQFGLSISNIGDINSDSFNDVAIGAPFGGPDGTGAVYIYNGASDGLKTTYSQKIYASDLPNAGMGGFSISISKGADVDNNGYSDFAIGSYSNGWVYLLRARPVATLKDNLIANATTVSPDSTNASCTGPDGKKYQCVSLSLNLQDISPTGASTLTVTVTIILDQQKSIYQQQRAYMNISNKFVSQSTEDVTLKKGESLPINKILYFKTGIDLDDVVTSVQIATSYKIRTDSIDCKQQLCPILDAYGANGNTLAISYQQLCDNSVCKTDLFLKEPTLTLDKNTTDLVFGVTNEFYITATVQNLGEPAYQATMKLSYNTDFIINVVEVNGVQYPWTSKQLNNSLNELNFPLGNPVNKNQVLQVKVSFGVAANRPSADIYVFNMSVFSLGNDVDASNNYGMVTMKSQIRTCINVFGYVDPTVVIYGSASYISLPENGASVSVAEIGPEFTAYFQISNFGPFDINSLGVNIKLMTSSEGKQIVYIVDILANGIRCNSNVNRNNLIVAVPASGNGGNTTISRKRRALDNINCGTGTCEVFICPITRIVRNNNVLIKVISRLLPVNLVNLQAKLSAINSSVEVSFSGPDASLNIQDPTRALCKLTDTATLKINPLSQQTSGTNVEWWWILLAVVGALILLAIVCAILYRVGFFRRKTLEELQVLQAEQAEQANGQKMPLEDGVDD